MIIQPPGSSRSPSSSFRVWEHKHHQIVFNSWFFLTPGSHQDYFAGPLQLLMEVLLDHKSGSSR